MLEYIKNIIVAIVTGLTAPLPVSSSAHFNFLCSVLKISGDEKVLAFYNSAFMLAFSLVMMFSLRKIYLAAFKGLSHKTPDGQKSVKAFNSRLICIGSLLSLVPTLVLFIPVSEGKLLMDYIESFFGSNGLILTGFACIITACVLIVSLWYTRNNTGALKNLTDIRSVLRMSFYQLPCYIIPGFSHMASGSTNLLISDVNSKVLVRELYLYFVPSLFMVSLARVIRYALSGLVFDPLVLITATVFFAAASKIVINIAGKVNIRRLFAFFAAYSFIFGIFTALASFFI